VLIDGCPRYALTRFDAKRRAFGGNNDRRCTIIADAGGPYGSLLGRTGHPGKGTKTQGEDHAGFVALPRAFGKLPDERLKKLKDKDKQ
jgi:hypothetical protein